MLFALDYLKRMEEKYPGVIDSIASRPDIASSKFALAQHGVSFEDHRLLLSLRAWKTDKVIYCFEREIADAITVQTEKPDYEIPVTFMKCLPYPCIAVQNVPFTLLDRHSDHEINAYTGNAFIWLAEGRLFSTWEAKNGQFEWTSLDLDRVSTFDDCFDALVKSNLKDVGINENDIPIILRLLRVDRFSDLTELTSFHSSRLASRFGEKKTQLITGSITAANPQEQILQRVIHIILYLNCSNADIEAAEERLKAGAWSNVIGGEELEYVPKTKRKQALQESKETRAFDVGYRIGGKFKRSYSADPVSRGQESKGTGSRGYGKRRAHYHHFWIGPRNGPLAEDIMNPAPGERGLVLYWLDATEIHPELKDDLATVIDVETQGE